MSSDDRIASLSVDLDNQWTYMKMHGVEGWQSFPSYFGVVVPRMLEFFKARSLDVTFLVVGQDAAIEEQRPALEALVQNGHEIGNHSFHHDTWMHEYPLDQIEEDVIRAERSISDVTQSRPVGFRAPGFGTSPKTIQILTEREYVYDASSFPNIVGPLAQAVFNRTSGLSAEEKCKRKDVFGTFDDAMRPIKPHFWNDERDGSYRLLEIPVTSMPIFRTPIHMTYVLYLGRYSRRLALSYFRAALRLCRVLDYQPSILLHPPDFLGSDDCIDMGFFPGMDISSDRKLWLLDRLMKELCRHYQIVTLRQHANVLLTSAQADKRVVVPMPEAVDAVRLTKAELPGRRKGAR